MSAALSSASHVPKQTISQATMMFWTSAIVRESRRRHSQQLINEKQNKPNLLGEGKRSNTTGVSQNRSEMN